jgi:hypothetical protein
MILVEAISHEPQQTIIPTLVRRAVKIYHYGAATPDIDAPTCPTWTMSAQRARSPFAVEKCSQTACFHRKRRSSRGSTNITSLTR